MNAYSLLQSVSDRLTKLYLQLATAFMFLLIFSTFMQVFTRYILNSSWPWTEEMARYAFIWMNMLGASAGFRKGTLVAVDLVPNALKGNAQRALRLLIMAIVFACGFVLFWYGIKLILRVGGSPSIVLRFPMGFVHAAIVAGGLGFMVNSLAGAVEIISNRQREEEKGVSA